MIMALIKCPECGKDVSDTADVCMNCGFSIRKWMKRRRKEAVWEDSRLESGEAGMPEGPVEQDAQSSKTPVWKNKWFLIGGGVVLAAIIAVVIILVVSREVKIPTF